MRDVGIILFFFFTWRNGDRKWVVQAIQLVSTPYTPYSFTVAELYIQFCIFAEKQSHAAEILILRREPLRISGAS